jgi:tetratricopeptide (TPR) repeat protein
MRFFDGLYSYEIVLLALGTLMFLVLLFAFVYSLVKKQALGRLFGFFLLPIVMIGFPVVSSIKLMNNLIEITKATRELEQTPTDKSAREDLVTAVQSVAARPFSNPETLTTIARAQVALGNDAGALTNLDKALRKDPNLPEAAQLKGRIELVRDMDKLTTHVENNPADAAAKAELKKKVTDVAKTPIANPETLAKVARAQAAVGDQEQAFSNAQKALTINPNLEAAKQVGSRIKAMRAQPAPNTK